VCWKCAKRIYWEMSKQDRNVLSRYGGTPCRSWSRHCATSRKVAGSIPDGVIGIFHWQNPSGRTMALGSTQALTEMSTGNIPWGGGGGYKGGRCLGLTTLPPSRADCLEIRERQPPGTLRASPGLYRGCYIFNNTIHWEMYEHFVLKYAAHGEMRDVRAPFE
jgi:hypothetical protein